MRSKLVVFAFLALTMALSLRPTFAAASNNNFRQNIIPVDCIIDQVYDGTNSITSIGSQLCREYIDHSVHQSVLDSCIKSTAGDNCVELEDISSISVARKEPKNLTDKSCDVGKPSQKRTIARDKKNCLCCIILLIVTNCLTVWLTRNILLRQKNKKTK